ncbi:hypothetical protein QN277_004627 [Acacia crassicarpa]|uniref:HMG box domain-containing protein n=1 Tax=Acacia crassicarpa TaxID=499986 RepID=A0AAE1J294_9FABA|nr:hypothetical protein QN277_004627 [Acacia crassicarpa]
MAKKADSTVNDNRLKRKGAGVGRKRRRAAKDPNKPKRPPSAFFVFMSEFREQYKKEHPDNKSVTAVGKAGGNEWRSMSDADKAPYVAQAQKKKAEYEKTIKAYNMRLAAGLNSEEGEGESDKSKSEVNDDENDDKEEEEEEAE